MTDPRDETAATVTDGHEIVSITSTYPAPLSVTIVWENPAGDVWTPRSTEGHVLPWAVVGAEVIGEGSLVYLIEGDGTQTWHRFQGEAFHEVAIRYAARTGTTGDAGEITR